MTWMAPIPTRLTSLAAHWVADGATFLPGRHADDGRYLVPGYIAVCGRAGMNEVDLSEDPLYGPPRPYCHDCETWLKEHDAST